MTEFNNAQDAQADMVEDETARAEAKILAPAAGFAPSGPAYPGRYTCQNCGAILTWEITFKHGDCNGRQTISQFLFGGA